MLENPAQAVSAETKSHLPGEGSPPKSPASPLPSPFVPCNLPHYQMIQLNQVGYWPASQPEIAAMPPYPEKEHLQPVVMCAVGCTGPLVVGLSEAPADSKEAATKTVSGLRKNEHSC